MLSIFSKKYLHFRKLPRAGMKRLDAKWPEQGQGDELDGGGRNPLKKERKPDQNRGRRKEGEIIKCEGGETGRT